MLSDYQDHLREEDIDFYEGQHLANNHVELYLASMRSERDSFWKIGEGEKTVYDDDYRRQTQNNIRDFIRDSPCGTILLSSEGLSLLRYEDELASLSEMVAGPDLQVSLLLYVRNKEDFLRSYREQILKVPGRKVSSDPDSSFYVEEDTWLADFDKLKERYSKFFGEANLTVIDYDEVLASDESVIPSFFRFLNIPICADYDMSKYRYNPGASKSVEPLTYLARLKRRLRGKK